MSEDLSRRQFLQRTGAALGSMALAGSGLLTFGCGSNSQGGSSGKGTIRIGQITDLTGALGFGGKADYNAAQLWVEQTNAKGGLLGKKLELVIEDSASDPAVGVTKARKLVEQDRVDMVIGGITSAMRDAIKGELMGRGKKLYIYPILYEGKDCEPYLFCTGPVPSQQVAPFVPFLMKDGAKRFYLPSADYVWPHTLNKDVRAAVEKGGGQVVAEEYFPLDVTDLSTAVNKIMSSNTDIVFSTLIPPGIWTFLQQLSNAGFQKRGGKVAVVYIDENSLSQIQPQYIEGVYSCLDYYLAIDDQFTQGFVKQYNDRFKDGTVPTAGNNVGGTLRGLQLWANAVTEAKTVEREAVRKALDHASVQQSLGGPVTMVPGNHHVKMNMYIGVAQSGKINVVQKLGQIDPLECAQGTK